MGECSDTFSTGDFEIQVYYMRKQPIEVYPGQNSMPIFREVASSGTENIGAFCVGKLWTGKRPIHHIPSLPLVWNQADQHGVVDFLVFKGFNVADLQANKHWNQCLSDLINLYMDFKSQVERALSLAGKFKLKRLVTMIVDLHESLKEVYSQRIFGGDKCRTERHFFGPGNISRNMWLSDDQQIQVKLPPSTDGFKSWRFNKMWMYAAEATVSPEFNLTPFYCFLFYKIFNYFFPKEYQQFDEKLQVESVNWKQIATPIVNTLINQTIHSPFLVLEDRKSVV